MEEERAVETSPTKMPISEMFVGAHYQGELITHVFAKDQHFIIYKCKGKTEVRYRYTDRAFSPAIARLEEVIHRGYGKFKGELIEHFNPLKVTAARRIFEGCSNEELEIQLAGIKSEIDRLPGVSRIIGRASNYCVWQNTDGELGYRISQSTPETESAISEFTRIQSLSADLLPKGGKTSFNGRLGAALHASFKLNLDCKETFQALERLVVGAMQNEVKVRLLVITFLFATLLIIIAVAAYYYLPLPNFLRLSLISATGGLAGALISFLERSKTTSVGEGDLAVFIILSNVCRVLIGGIFGVIAFAAANADIAFSLFKASKPALLILGVVAGFSERLIPDVLGTIASSKTQTNGEDKES